MSGAGRAELRTASLSRTAVLGGVRWSAVAQVAVEVAALAGSVVLARLIGPAEFGRAAVALILPPVALALAFQGVGSVLVQRSSVRSADVETAMLLALAVGAALTALVAGLAGPVAGPLFGAETAGLLTLMAPVFLVAALRVVPFALLQRRLAFRRLATIEIGARVAGTLLTVALAIAGLQASALVLGALGMAALSAVGLMASAPPPPPRWHGREMREIARFGVPAALASLTNTLGRNVDYAILAARLSASQVGIYWRAFQLGVEYQTKLTNVTLRVAFPVFSRAGDLERMRALRLRMARANATLIVPLLALFVALAPTLVPWLFGERWEPAVEPAQLLAVVGMLAALMTGNGPLLLAAGHPRAVLAWNALTLVLVACAAWFAAPAGLTAVCAGVIAANAASLAGGALLLLRPLAGLSPGRLVAEAVPGVATAAALLAVAGPVAWWLGEAGVDAVPTMLAVAGAGAVAATATLRLGFPAAWRDLALIVRR